MNDVERLALALQRQGLQLEAQALRLLAKQYDNLKFADLVAMVGLLEDEANMARRVERADDLMNAFRQAAADLQQPPAGMQDLLRTSLNNGATTAAQMLALQAGAPELFDAFRIRPDLEIDYSRHVASRLVRYWGAEQQQFADRVQSVIVEALERGQGRQVITAKLREQEGLSRNRASLIARNELGNAASYGMQQTQQQSGVTEYKWFTARDDRVRGNPGGRYKRAVPSHYHRHGQVFRWDTPPSDGHPGQPIQCRCVALAVLPDNWREMVKGTVPAGPVVAPPAPPPVDTEAQRSADLKRQAAEVRARLKDEANFKDAARADLQRIIDERAPLGMADSRFRNASTSLRRESGFDWDRAVQRAQRDAVKVANSRLKVQVEAAWEADADIYPVPTFDLLGDVRAIEDFIDVDLPLQVRVATFDQGRAYAVGDTIAVSATSQNTRTVIHEVAHIVERRHEQTRQQVFAYFEERTAGKPLRKLADLYPGEGYSDREQVHEGAFKWASSERSGLYAGKRYANEDGSLRDTELLSMGLERMYIEPAEFAKDDPEFFDFIFTVARGGKWK